MTNTLVRGLLALAIAVVVIAGAGIGIKYLVASQQPETRPFQTTSMEPRIRRAYEIAREIPDVLEQIPCHCGCMRNKLGHSNNLDCFRTEHGESCWMCVAIAHDVDVFTKQGASIDWLRRYVTNVYTFNISDH